MGVKISNEGIFTSIQDRGRFGYAGIGVPQSGAMDRYSAKIANMLVGNEDFEAVMECTLIGPNLLFQNKALVALAGLAAEVSLNNQKIELLRPFKVNIGDELHIKQITQGTRLYLAINEGFQTEEVLNSRSYYTSVTKKEKLEKNDVIPFNSFTEKKKRNYAKINYNQVLLTTNKIKVYKGPEWHLLPKKLQEQILKDKVSISKNTSRMAYQIEEKFPNKLSGMLSQPVLPGTVQLTPDGNLIILMRDAQTTGGYPRVLQLAPESINTLAQKKQGDMVCFKMLKKRKLIIK
ncbi:5-oxoprolinase subunit C family protein [Haloflavibacter putidus]|uniref:Biotin-dependent carboxyltransferase family protein n=1 Tax=Haloflavibacter putidus TaxID=2576776 RepID=A0A507ZS76_9FLAO|nr:biotin-dependent carboxyltransferase family protein [Haloflavibacter putidus]TQD39124.1 biotin-dependent carboxyltransferase family protein [Haloflavibacter putidus]